MSDEVMAARAAPGLGLALRYACFAALAMAINLAAQAVSLSIYRGPLYLGLAMALGTLAGLIPKYALDKRWIFNDRSTGLDSHARRFSVYSLMSVATTLIFWSTETLFDRLGHGDSLHYLGGLIGLCLGYTAKYHLDRRFTFGRAP